MKYIFPLIFIILILFLQIGVLPGLAISRVFPNLILISVLSLAILSNWKKNIGWIVAAGLFFDFYSLNNILGISVLALLVASITAGFSSSRLLKKNDNLSILLVFFLGLAVYEIIFFIFPASLVRIIYDLIFVLPIFYLIKFYVDKIQKIQSQKTIL